MKFRHKILTPLIIILAFLITLILPAYAWYDNTFSMSYDILGKSRVSYQSYFADGTGIDTDPFIIAEPEHLFNLAYLQNLGLFDTVQYYFKVADPETGGMIDIDFSEYHSIPPIGDFNYPFKGYFDGNYSTLKYIAIDGYGKQDIGVFGFTLGVDTDPNTEGYEWTAEVTNLFIEEPIIFSNPSSSDYSSSFHSHNDDIINRATGYIVGHLGSGSTLNNVFVSTATIDSLANADSNRSQYGLIGFNDSDHGYVAGSPRNSYSFALNANSTYTALVNAKNAFGTYYINGGSTTTLNDVLINNIQIYGGYKNYDLNSYTLSTLKISQTPNDSDPPYLYDVMSANGYKIETLDSEFSRVNIDLVGLLDVVDVSGSKSFGYEPVLNRFTSPLIGSYFNVSTYDHSIVLYVKPTNNPGNMGVARISGNLNGSGQLGFYPGFDSYGNYLEDKRYLNKNDLSLITGINVDLTLSVYNAFVALVRDPDANNPDRLRVVDPQEEWPDFYVFVVGTGNGFVNVSEVSFEYKPAALEAGQLSSIQRIDFINKDWISQIITDLLDEQRDYDFSYVNYGYELSECQKLEILTSRTSIGVIEIYLDYDITDGSYFYFDILNVNAVSIILYVKNTSDVYVEKYPLYPTYLGNEQIIECVLSIDGVTGEPVVIVNAYNNTS
jgi:hypothetical protein